MISSSGSSSAKHEPRRLRQLADLLAEPRLSAGRRLLVEEDGIVHISVGRVRPEIGERLGWTYENVWMPEHVLRYIEMQHAVITDPIVATATILQQPASVHEDRVDPTKRYFVMDAAELRGLGLLTSQSTRYVDAVVELRQVPGGNLPRLFHRGPRKRNRGGRQLWP